MTEQLNSGFITANGLCLSLCNLQMYNGDAFERVTQKEALLSNIRIMHDSSSEQHLLLGTESLILTLIRLLSKPKLSPLRNVYVETEYTCAQLRSTTQKTLLRNTMGSKKPRSGNYKIQIY